jgi:hypothetical protein
MKAKLLSATFASLVLFSSVHAQAVDKAKLDRFLDGLLEKIRRWVKQPLTAASRF